MRILSATLVTMLSLLAAPFAGAADGDAQRTLVERILKHDPTLRVLDVRTVEEFGVAHLVGASNVPHDQIELRASTLPKDKSAEIVVYCRSGRRSAMALTSLQKLGYTRVQHLEGDFIGWQAAGRPVEPAPATAPATVH